MYFSLSVCPLIARPKSFDFNYTRSKDKDRESQLALRTRKGTPNQWPQYKSTHDPPAMGSASVDHRYTDYHNSQQLQSQRGALSEWRPTNAQLVCQVADVYPVPEMVIYRVSDDDSKTEVLTEIDQKAVRNDNGAYNVTLTSDIRDYELVENYGSHRGNYECLLIQADGSKNNYQRKKRITYLTGQ